MTLLSLYVNRLVAFLMKVAMWLGVALCIAMTVSTLGQVFCRHTQLFLFESSEEIARFSMCWLAMLGSAVALRQGRHLGVRVLVDRLPAGVYDRWLAPLIQFVMLAFFVMVMIKGWQFAMRGAYQVSPALMLPMMYPYLCLPVGGALMALSVFADMLQDRFPTEAGSNASIASTIMEDLGEIAAETEKAVEIFDPLSKPKKD
ncbi:TRAP transporter small permease [Mailhella sp.]|uniref:TRAP transporter small permease n=1 Tax=Mailhella sp. TaxID=1981029 RepID=UPI004063B3E3